jgi:hypothetical protein
MGDLRPFTRVFGHPVWRVLIEECGTQVVQQMVALLSNYFYEDNSRLRGLQ